MKVRKVPMKKRGTFDQDGNEKPIPAHKPESDNAEPMDTDTLDTVINEDESAIQTALSAIRTLLLTDRALHDKAAKAFVSSARAYGAHEASFVFRMRDVDLCGAAQCYGLLRMPRMPEWAARNEGEKARWVDAEVDWDAYSYKDVGQERKRQEELKGRENKREKGRRAARERREARERNGAWSREGGRKEERGKRREKRVLKAKWTRAQAEKEAEAKGGVGAVDADAGEPLEEARMVVEDADLDEEMEDWAEERAAKKAKLVPLSVVEGAFDDL
jgi:ATP-dependent RNA helicase DDX55/SPB4